MSNQPGAILDIVESKANELIMRGTANALNDQESPPSKEEIYEKKGLTYAKNSMFLKRNAVTKSE